MKKKLETITPGPWQVHASPTKALGYMITRAALGPGGGIHIGNVYSEDNARLIAAAPQLLEALKGAISALEHVCEYADDIEGTGKKNLIAARIAIAAATGDA